MRQFYKITLLISVMLLSTMTVSAKYDKDRKFDLNSFRYKAKSGSIYEKSALKRVQNQYTPDFTLGPSSYTGNIDAPGGVQWLYTADYEYDMIPADHDAGIYYDNYILKHYRFTIYDDHCRQIGVIDAPVEYQDDESKVVSIELAPVASRHFFNTDDNVEVMVALSINTKTPGYNHYRSLIYSIPAEKSEEPVSVSSGTINSILSDVIEGPASSDGRDRFYMIFGEDVLPEDVIEDEDASFWDYVTAGRVDITFYGPAENDADGAVKIDVKQMPLLQLPGDQESTPYVMSYLHNGKVTYLFSYLEEPVWERYDDPLFGEIMQREDNKLNLEFYEVDGNSLKLVHKTSLKVGLDQNDDKAIASFYGVGDMNYTSDLLYDAPGAKDGKPWMVVTRSNYNPASDNSSLSYFVYDSEGNMQYPLAEYCESSMPLSDVEGYEPQQMFITFEDGAYLFNFVDLYSGKKRLEIPNIIETPAGDMEPFMANLDRVADSNGYHYAAEMSYPEDDLAGNTFVRILWFNDKGETERIDKLNAGQNVQYASVYIDGAALDPKAFCKDEAPEYLYLVKRGVSGNVLNEELLLSQPVSESNPQGLDLLCLGADSRGSLSGIIPVLGVDNPTLTVYYYNDDNLADSSFSQDIYNLPFGCPSSIGSVNGEDAISVKDGVINAKGLITVYNMAGVKISETNESFDLESLGSGIYMIVAGDSKLKVCVK